MGKKIHYDYRLTLEIPCRHDGTRLSAREESDRILSDGLRRFFDSIASTESIELLRVESLEFHR